jgi:hypothetical protein
VPASRPKRRTRTLCVINISDVKSAIPEQLR